MMRQLLLAAPILLLSVTAQASDGTHSHGTHTHTSKYAGQETNAIKSLSPGDIAELKRGGGWGLAKAAELNGVPGPLHLLEMRDDIPLDGAQVAAITKIYDHMKSQAIEKGATLIAREQALEAHFKNRTITDAILRTALQAIADARRDLRYVHLAAHLKTPDILSEDQIKTYNALRGYGATDPCATIPKGHDAEMWRKHNGCD